MVSFIKKKIHSIPVISGFLLVVILFCITLKNSFFWDTIQLGSKHAGFYYSQNFSSLLLPDSIDSGHIPAFGMLLALAWKVFGRSLLVSHLFMLPFVLGILWQLRKLTAKIIPDKYAGWAFLLVLIDPTLLSQMTLVSPDVVLVFFFLSGWNSILENKKFLLSLSITCLFLVSMRGMMVSFCLLLLDVGQNISFSQKVKPVIRSLLQRSLIYLPALVIMLSFSVYHYQQKEWIGYHEDSPWAGSFERVGFSGLLHNMGILVWRIIDFGRIGIWAILLFMLYKFRGHTFVRKESRVLAVFFLILLVFLPLNMVWAKNLLGHRYLLPVFLAFALLCASLLFSSDMSKKLRRALVTLWIMVLLGGNLWVYPVKISQGWDATLGHLPYYKIRQQAIEYIDQQNIEFSSVQSFFPNVSTMDETDLNGDYRKFSSFTNDQEYVLYSNVFNVSDEEYHIIHNDYTVIRQFKKGFLYFNLCRKKN